MLGVQVENTASYAQQQAISIGCITNCRFYNFHCRWLQPTDYICLGVGFSQMALLAKAAFLFYCLPSAKADGNETNQFATICYTPYPLAGEVHVDEFFIGGPEEQKRGRSKGQKRLVVLALEKVDEGVGRAYAQIIEQASGEEFKPFFNSYIKKDAKVITDEWNGYLPLIKDYPNLKQIPSKEGKSFSDLHIHIMNLKGWLRGIHHHCDKERLQGYLDEYHFRYNRRNNMDTIFDLLIKRMTNNDPIRLNSIS
jgi:hypothetical protein